MSNSEMHPEGWISLSIDPKFELRAKQMRASRDEMYGNIFSENSTDERWVGDLGEIVFNSWLKHEGIENFHWVLDEAANQPDFIARQNIRIGVKTVKRQVPPKLEYTAQITARHVDEPVDQFFFLTYEIVRRKMWLLGGLARESFLASSRLYKAGEFVHPNYQVRQGHEIYNIEILKLIRPKEWLKQTLLS